MNRQKVAWALVLVLALAVAGMWKVSVFLDETIVIYRDEAFPGLVWAAIVFMWVWGGLFCLVTVIILGIVGITNYRKWRDDRAEAKASPRKDEGLSTELERGNAAKVLSVA